MTRDEVLERLDAAGEPRGPIEYEMVRKELLRAAAELIRAGGWRPIAEAPKGQILVLVGRWHRGWWQWKETWFAGQAMEDGYTHYLPEPEPPAREVPNE